MNIDPLFVDATNGNFHLKGSSLVIDKGINKGIPRIDFEGDERILGIGVDMGADEYQTLVPTPTPTPTPPCEPEEMTAEPKKVAVAIDSNAQEMITITCEDGNPVEGEPVTWKIKRGAENIAISPENTTTDMNGQALFTITGVKKGKAKIEFQSGDLKVKVKVKVTK